MARSSAGATIGDCRPKAPSCMLRSIVCETPGGEKPMCSGAILLYRIPTIVIGENRNFKGPEEYLRSRGVDVRVAMDATCVQLMAEFIRDRREQWSEDIGERS